METTNRTENVEAVLRTWKMDYERIHKACGTCGHSAAAHTEHLRCKVAGCKNATARAHNAN